RNRGSIVLRRMAVLPGNGSGRLSAGQVVCRAGPVRGTTLAPGPGRTTPGQPGTSGDTTMKNRKKQQTPVPADQGKKDNRVDRTGIVPGNVRIDPDLTPGHPGYEVSGGPETIPPE